METASGSHSCGNEELEKKKKNRAGTAAKGFHTVSELMWLAGQEAATVGDPENAAPFLENDSAEPNLFQSSPEVMTVMLNISQPVVVVIHLLRTYGVVMIDKYLT